MNRSKFALIGSKLSLRQRTAGFLVLKRKVLKIQKASTVENANHAVSNLELETEIAGNIQLR